MVLTIKEVMDSHFVTATDEVTVHDGAQRMVAARHGFVLLVDQDRPTGIVTEWDLVEKVVARGADPRTISLGSIATRAVVSCDQNMATGDVIDIMVSRGIRRMVITDGGRVVGVVGAKDVLRSFRAYVDRISADIARLQSSFP
ncbi:MAG: CBS domain-containing protein [Thermoplasmata archaeon]|nr:CBS domain-containing protein [Thermoplasmata archaeon]